MVMVPLHQIPTFLYSTLATTNRSQSENQKSGMSHYKIHKLQQSDRSQSENQKPGMSHYIIHKLQQITANQRIRNQVSHIISIVGTVRSIVLLVCPIKN